MLVTPRPRLLGVLSYTTLADHFDKRKESTIQQCKPLEFISEAKLLGRYLLHSLMESHSIHVEAIFRFPINTYKKKIVN